MAARDSLRLEMGYPLYGHDLDETTTPVEADIAWIVGKENEGFIGAETVLAQRVQMVQTENALASNLLAAALLEKAQTFTWAIRKLAR